MFACNGKAGSHAQRHETALTLNVMFRAEAVVVTGDLN